MRKKIFFMIMLVAAAIIMYSCDPPHKPDQDPVQRNLVLVEYFTTEKCPKCPLGMKKAYEEIFSQVSEKMFLVCHHVGFYEDKFTVGASRPLMFFYGPKGTYAPGVMLDRSYITGNSVVFFVGHLYKGAIENRYAEKTYAKLDMNVSFNDANKELKVDVSGELLKELPNAKVNVYLVQNGISSDTQENGGNGYIHKNVLRAALAENYWGDSVGTTKGKFSKSYTYTINDQIENIPTDINNMYVVAFVAEVNNISDYSEMKNNTVLNAVSKKIK